MKKTKYRCKNQKKKITVKHTNIKDFMNRWYLFVQLGRKQWYTKRRNSHAGTVMDRDTVVMWGLVQHSTYLDRDSRDSRIQYSARQVSSIILSSFSPGELSRIAYHEWINSFMLLRWVTGSFDNTYQFPLVRPIGHKSTTKISYNKRVCFRS